MQKTKRLLAIEKIIAEENISSQDILLKKLKGKGIICTQATLSRNLRQIGAGRIPDGKGGYRYLMSDIPRSYRKITGKLQVLPAIQEIIDAKGLMVIRTLPGNASSTAYYIDNSGRFEIAGTIAGDDTILVIPRDGITIPQVHSCLEIVLPGLHDKVKNK
ncbi:MAG: ArgR family transcriptional regulator [Bacteroidales bacterium]|nr:ArgR family transcriptional regulator [Bacteroidales bacterium]